MEQWGSLRSFAKARGVTLAAVQKAIKSGRVTAVRRDEGGRITGIEFGQAAAQWNAMTDPAQSARSTPTLELALAASPATAVAQVAAGAEPPSSDGGGKDPHGYHASRARREQFEANKAELEYLEAIGAVVSAEEIRTIGARRYRATRDAILAVADQEAAILAAERDPVVVRERLLSALRKALHGLADQARAEAAGGTPERLAA